MFKSRRGHQSIQGIYRLDRFPLIRQKGNLFQKHSKWPWPAGEVIGLRSAMSMARLWAIRANDDSTPTSFSRGYGWFSEGFDTLDLKQARTLLKDLA